MPYFQKNFFCVVAVLGYLAKLKRGFGEHSLPDFSIKIFFIKFSINGKSFDVTPYFFHKWSNKMCYSVLI